ncbi:response regulator transcription factor [Streptomyces sp. NBC_01362]|uniref:response regulator transcription factor n=1 Tax=Streptomyces sp. NBC_01362 TaxID=2903839 RepID=UPI002E37531B|nr:response regulator transcription factor [Streptomyces sp. NBC_01362]
MHKQEAERHRTEWHRRAGTARRRPRRLISPAVTVRLLRHISAPTTGKRPIGANPLTSRETELARLVARGCSNADIAAELFVSVGTVKTHVANIQAKLGVANRVGIAAWTWETGRATP